jgi:hypothetical protein
MWCSFYFDDTLKRFTTNNIIERSFKDLKTALPTPPPCVDILVQFLFSYMVNIDKKIIISKTKLQVSKQQKNPFDDIVLRMKKKSEYLLMRLQFDQNKSNFNFHSTNKVVSISSRRINKKGVNLRNSTEKS